MAYLNSVSIIGNITRDIEVRVLASGKSVAEFGVAATKKFKSEGGQSKEDVLFVDVACFGKTAEIVGDYLHKGSKIFLHGSLKLDSWEDKQTGQKRNKIKIVANDIQFLDRKPSESPRTTDAEDEIPF